MMKETSAAEVGNTTQAGLSLHWLRCSNGFWHPHNLHWSDQQARSVSRLIQLKFQDRLQRLAVMGQLLRQNLAPYLER